MKKAKQYVSIWARRLLNPCRDVFKTAHGKASISAVKRAGAGENLTQHFARHLGRDYNNSELESTVMNHCPHWHKIVRQCRITGSLIGPLYSRPKRPRLFRSAPIITTSLSRHAQSYWLSLSLKPLATTALKIIQFCLHYSTGHSS